MYEENNQETCCCIKFNQNDEHGDNEQQRTFKYANFL